MKKQFVIIGASAAGVAAAARLRMIDQEASIICISDEAEFPYNKCFLAEYLSGLKEISHLNIKSDTFFEDARIELVLNTKIIKIDKELKKIIAHNGKEFVYDKLLYATGGSLKVLPLKGIDAQGVFEFYTLKDTQNILEYAQKQTTEHVVIIGAGLSGMECADALLGYVKKITIVDMQKHVLFRLVPEDAACFLQNKMEEHGVLFVPHTTVKEIIHTHGIVTSVICSDGSTIQADMVVCALGAQPNSQLARDAGLIINNNLVVTNSFLQTSDPHIFAAGDVIQTCDQHTKKEVKSCTWPDALMQGGCAAFNMAGIEKEYGGVTIIAFSEFFGMKFYVTGNCKEISMSHTTTLRKTADSYRLIVAKSLVVQGFLLIGNSEHFASLKRSLILQQQCDTVIS
ncbi:FAD-dependent oxidoreductase [Candidatus Babeliales bacterium]|nr:FAD-dependent oxidoreductase [Candidatus Babeliales bacterium]